MESEIHIARAYVEGLEGIEGYSHILVVYWMDRVDPVLDIKPYWPQYDHVEAPEYPAWVEKLEF